MSKKTSASRMTFLMTFFENEEGYEELEVNGFWLIKQFNGNKKVWEVHIYPAESYANYKKTHEVYNQSVHYGKSGNVILN